jgi:DNA-binding CsgD family transcriptional regulator
MATESLTYAQIAERLGINAEAARGLVRRYHLPRSTPTTARP